MKKIIYLFIFLICTTNSVFASNESQSEKVGAAFISGLIFTIGIILFNWLKSKNNKN